VVIDFGGRSPDIVGRVPGAELGTIESHPTGSDVQESCGDNAGIGGALGVTLNQFAADAQIGPQV
jgi:hypothetical protein